MRQLFQGLLARSRALKQRTWASMFDEERKTAVKKDAVKVREGTRGKHGPHVCVQSKSF